MAERAMRAWVAHCRWPGRKPFYAGTVWARYGAPMHEIEAEVRREFAVFLGEILPEGWTHPDIMDLIPGMIVFHPDTEDADA